MLLEESKTQILQANWFHPTDNSIYGTTFLNPLIKIPKVDTIKVVLDARHLNLKTDQSFESWPTEPLVPQLARANKKFKSAIDLMYAYAHPPLGEKIISLASFHLQVTLRLHLRFLTLKDYYFFKNSLTMALHLFILPIFSSLLIPKFIHYI